MKMRRRMGQWIIMKMHTVGKFSRVLEIEFKVGGFVKLLSNKNSRSLQRLEKSEKIKMKICI
jgi:hypothetical protein